MSAKGELRITNKHLQKLFNLPEGVIITDAEHDSKRDITSFIIRSSEPVDELTFNVEEGAHVKCSYTSP